MVCCNRKKAEFRNSLVTRVVTVKDAVKVYVPFCSTNIEHKHDEQED